MNTLDPRFGPETCVDIRADAPDTFGPMVYDGASSGIEDLFHPLYKKMLILSSDGNSTDPQYDGDGGSFTFYFNTTSFHDKFSTVFVAWVTYIDLENVTSFMFKHRSDGTLIVSPQIDNSAGTGDGEINKVKIYVDLVEALTVKLPSFGAIATVAICIEEGTTTTSTSSSTSTSTTTSTTTSSISSTSSSTTTSTTTVDPDRGLNIDNTDSSSTSTSTSTSSSSSGSTSTTTSTTTVYTCAYVAYPSCEVKKEYRRQCGGYNISRQACYDMGCCYHSAFYNEQWGSLPDCYCPSVYEIPVYTTTTTTTREYSCPYVADNYKHNPSSYTCNIEPAYYRQDCGWPGITFAQCIYQGCCWRTDYVETNSSVPNCFCAHETTTTTTTTTTTCLYGDCDKVVFVNKEYIQGAGVTRFHYDVSCCDLSGGYGMYRQINRWSLMNSEDLMKLLVIDPTYTSSPSEWSIGHSTYSGQYGLNSEINIYCDGQPRRVTVSFQGHVNSCPGSYFTKASNGWHTSCSAEVPCLDQMDSCPELYEPVNNNAYYCDVQEEYKTPCDADDEASCNYLGCCWKSTYYGSGEKCFCAHPTTTTSTPAYTCGYTADGYVVDSDAYYCSQIHELDRYDCGWSGVDEAQCAARGCCWRASSGNWGDHIPWCYCPNPTTTTTPPPAVCPSAHYYPADSNAYYCTGVTQKTDCAGGSHVTKQECEENLGCCWNSDVYSGPFCFCPLAGALPANPAWDIHNQCWDEAWARVNWKVAEYWNKPQPSCSDFLTMTQDARDLGSQFGIRFSDLARQGYDLAPTVDAAAGCTWALHEMYRQVAESWEFWAGPCTDTMGELADAWKAGATSFQGVFAPYGGAGTGAASASNFHFSDALSIIIQMWEVRTQWAPCVDVQLHTPGVEKILTASKEGARAWADYAKSLPGHHGVKTGMSIQWSDLMRDCASGYQAVMERWADSCTGDVTLASAISDELATYLGRYSEAMEAVQDDWAEAFYIADGDCFGGCFNEVEWAHENWRTVDYFSKFGQIASAWGNLFEVTYPNQGSACSRTWSEAYKKYGISVKRMSTTWSKLFETSSVVLGDKSHHAGSAANKMALTAISLCSAFDRALHWSSLVDTSNSLAWASALEQVMWNFVDAAGIWADVFPGTKWEMGLKTTGWMWAEAMDVYGNSLMAYTQHNAGHQAPVTGTPEWTTASWTWGLTWRALARGCRTASKSVASKFDPWGALAGGERDTCIQHSREVSDRFRLSFENNAWRLRDSSLGYFDPNARVAWESAGLEADESCRGRDAELSPETAAWAFKLVLDPFRSPADWDDAGWSATLTSVGSNVQSIRSAYSP